MDLAFFTVLASTAVHTPHARTHQQQLACMHERTGMHEPVCICAGSMLLLHGSCCCCCCWLLLVKKLLLADSTDVHRYDT
jgi:hypothetical protein